MPQKFSNAARALLTAAITPSATSFSVESSKADLFPVANAGTATLPSSLDWFKAVLQDGTGDYEIVYVRTRASGSATFSNVLRGQEGTTARSWAAGTVVGLRVTAGDMELPRHDAEFTGQTKFDAGTASAPSITRNGDTNTGVFFPANDTVSVSTGGSERLRIDSAGNVGIGTTTNSTGSRLYVAGEIAEIVGGVQTKLVSLPDIGVLPNQVPLNQHLGNMAYVDNDDVSLILNNSCTPHGVRQMVFELTNDTTLTIKVRGSDGTVRSAVITLA